MLKLYTVWCPLFSAFLLLLYGCGKVVEVPHYEQVDLHQTLNSDLFAEHYFVDDESCFDGLGINEIGESTIFQWQGDQTQEVSIVPKNFVSNGALSSQAIAKTVAGYHDRSLCDGIGENCKIQQVFSAGRDVKICKSNYTYPRKSVEGIALTSLQYLTESYDYYNSLPGKRPINRAGLYVLPRFEQKVADEVYVKTDNLAYSGATNRGPIFFVYPKGKLIAQLGYNANLNFWEIPWALHHEYGHHVFRSHLFKWGREFSLNHDNEMVSLLAQEAEARHQGETGLAASNLLSGQKSIREVDGVDHYVAVNEAFADLFAFYQNKETSSDLNGVDCFEKTRQVESSVFHTNDKKILSDDVLTIYLHTKKITAVYCQQIDYQDPHMIGAIIAHQVNNSLNAGKDFLASKLDLAKWVRHIQNERWQSCLHG